MNLLLLTPDDHVEGDRYVVRGRRAEHLRDVLDVAPGRELRCGLVDGPLGAAHVVQVRRRVELDVVFEHDVPPRPRTSLVLAVPRPRSLTKLLPQVAALGVDRIVLLRTWKVAKPYLTAEVLTPERTRELLLRGLEQARCTRVPEVRVEPLFRPYVEDRLADEFAEHRRLVLHPGEPRRLGTFPVDAEAPVVLAVGPEGGWVPFEVEALAAARFERVGLGPRVLRVETACVAALALTDAARVSRT